MIVYYLHVCNYIECRISIYMYVLHLLSHTTYIHDVIGDVERKKERKKERKTPEAMEK